HEAGDAVLRRLARAILISHQDRHTRGRGLERRERDALAAAVAEIGDQRERVRGAIERRQIAVVDAAGEEDAIGEASVARALLGVGAARAVAPEDEPRRDLPRYPSEGVDEAIVALVHGVVIHATQREDGEDPARRGDAVAREDRLAIAFRRRGDEPL